MMVRSYRRTGFLLLFTGFLTATEAATLSDGYIVGEVVSVTGDPVASARVTASNVDTGYEINATTNAAGGFRLKLLPPGNYTLSAVAADFDRLELPGVGVRVGTGTNVLIALRPLATGAEIDEIVVVASRISRIDLQSSESTLTFEESFFDQVPIARERTGIAMLTPGAVQADQTFGNNDRSGYYASFGGSSAGENAYYINGMNVTNFRNGRGGATAPFEFFQEYQVKYGGISAEYGRATGGFINSLTKRGTNDFHYGMGVFYEPESLATTSPNVISDEGIPVKLGSLEPRRKSEAFVYASGPIVRDRLFFYGIYNPRDFDVAFAGGNYTRGTADDAFWGLKLDYEISGDHLAELTVFSNEHDFNVTIYDLDQSTLEILDERGEVTAPRGGQHWILKYSGHFGQSFTIAALAGESEEDFSQTSPNNIFPVIIDHRAPEFFTPLGSWSSFTRRKEFDERQVGRLDFEWETDSHLVRAGIDYESNTSLSIGRYSGDERWDYWDATPGEELPTGTVPDGVTQVASRNISEFGGSYDIKTSSWYVEDSWQVSPSLLLNIGLRNETFDNRNALGETIIKITNQWAPRLGFAWNVGGDGSSKLYASYGRYHLPVPSGVNIGLGGASSASEEWFVLDGLNADDTPILGPQIGSAFVFSDGEVVDPKSLVDSTIEPMYQDEFTIGYQREIGDNYVFGVMAVRRELGRAIEDISINQALTAYAQNNGFPEFVAPGIGPYILTNPGTRMRIGFDLDGDGALEDIELTADELGLPEVERKYSALNVFFEHIWDGVWFGRLDYTWSKNYGNFEGYFSSDFGQDNAGFTFNFDFPAYMEYSKGNLPNDRRHSVRLYGSWQFRPSWTISANASWSTGRPKNTFGFHPTDPFRNVFGSSAFYTPDGNPAPRGSRGTTPSVTNLDLSLAYEHEIFSSASLRLQVDVFNVFNSDTPVAVHEMAQLGNGALDSRYGLARAFQTPRYVRLGAQLDF